MKIALLSDLHLSVHPLAFTPPDVDVVVLAGDLQRPAQAMAWAAQMGRPTVFVAGNHEFYGSDLVTTMAQLREHARGTEVRVLERNEWHHGGVRFLGCTLWSNYRLFDSTEQREEGLRKAQEFVRDFSRIAIAPDFPDRFTPAVSQMLFDQSVAWLEERFAETFDGPTVVVTHFAPTPASIASQFVGSPLNACFVSDLEAHILRWQPSLWLHGHVHHRCDYRVGNTRVVANPRGYAPEGVAENKAFMPDLLLEL